MTATDRVRARVRLTHRSRLVSLVGVVLCASFALPASATAGHHKPGASWVAAWGEPVNDAATTSFTNKTIRVLLRASVGGTQTRIRLSNASGVKPLTLENAHVGLVRSGAELQPGNNVPVTFHGSRKVTIPAGEAVLSDPVKLRIAALAQLAVSVYARGTTGPGSGGNDMDSYYTADGDRTADTGSSAFGSPTTGTYFVTGLDVFGPNAGLIVALGDSITVGFSVSDPNEKGWGYWLAQRLARHEQTDGLPLSVITMAISGNMVSRDKSPTPTDGGISAEHRLQRDVLDQTGLRGVLMLEGVNDIGNTGEVGQVPTREVIAAYARIVRRVRAHGAGILISPILPAGDMTRPVPYGPNYSDPAGVQERHDLNDWIRRKSGAYSPLFDLEQVTEDPQFPNHLAVVADSGDDLHPSSAGQQMMANSIDLRLLRQLALGRVGR